MVRSFGFAVPSASWGLLKTPGLASLLGFNLGVEVDQLAVVWILLPVP